jgi:hypothetical protein
MAAALSAATAPDAGRNDVESQQLAKAYGQLPLGFEQNRGQADSRVRFLSRGSGYSLALTPDSAVLALQSAMGSADSMQMKLVGANAEANPVGLDELPGKSNYFIGNDPKKWHRNVPTYSRVKYERVYPGVDLVYYGNRGQLEYDFVVGPGADPRRIELEVASDSSAKPRIDSNGDLLLKLGGGELRFRKPLVYQGSGENRSQVDGRFVVRSGNHVGFEVAGYDSTKPLVIDPAITYSSYLGGTTGGYPPWTLGFAIATYTEPVTGHVYTYVTGTTCTSDFPTVNAWQPVFGGEGGFPGYFGCDAFVTKFDPSAAGAASVVYSTFLGGSGSDEGTGIAVDTAGNAYTSGSTGSTNFPTVNGYQTVNRVTSHIPGYPPNPNAFVSKLSPDGSTLLYSTYFGGTNGEGSVTAIALDVNGHAYIAGGTASTDLSLLNPFQAGPHNPLGNAFVAAFDTTRSGPSSLLYSTYLGGSSATSGDYAVGIAVDAAGTIHLAGAANTNNFPTVNGFQTTPGGAFYARLNPNAIGAAQLIYSTYLGGTTDANGLQIGVAKAIALDSAGNAYIAGVGSTPGSSSAFFIVKINSSLAGAGSLVYSVPIGRSSGPGGVFGPQDACGSSGLDAEPIGIAVDADGNAFVAACAAPGLPLVNPVQSSSNGVFESIDGGQTWTGLTSGLTDFPINVLVVDVSTSPRTLYAGTQLGSVFASADGGASWIKVLQLPAGGADNGWCSLGPPPCVFGLAVDPATPSNVYAGTSAGVYRSADRGATWSTFNTGLSSTAVQGVRGLLFDNFILYAGAGDGLYQLSSGTTIWTRTGLGVDVRHIAVDPTSTPHTLYTSSEYSGAYKSIDGGVSWTSFSNPGDLLFYVVVDPTSVPGTLYGKDYYSSNLSKSVDGGNTWVNVAYPQNDVFDDVAYSAMALDTSRSPAILYSAAPETDGYIYKSVDGGNTWNVAWNGFNTGGVGPLAVDVSTATATSPATLYTASFNPHGDAFVAELNPSGSALSFSSYLGGICCQTFGNAIALDTADNIYVTGATSTEQFPVINAYQTTLAPRGIQSAFLTKIGSQTLPLSSSGSFSTQVAVQAGALAITLPNITGSTTGAVPTLTVAPLSSASTANFSLSSNLGAYDISTTATFDASTSNPVTLCFQANTVNDPSTFSGLEIMHVVNGFPQNVTTSYDFTTRTICGAVTSLSPFVLVKGPVGQLSDLVRMVTESDVKHGIQTSLDAKLQAASSALSDAKKNAYTTACNVLGAFISDVQAQTGKSITQSDANTFIGAAQELKATISCAQ